MTDILEVKLHGGLPWLMFAQCGLWTSCRWIQQYQNLQRWSVAHCELQNSSVMWSLYVGASVVQSPPVTSVMARGVWAGLQYLLRHRGYGARSSHHCHDCPTADHESLLWGISQHVEQIWHCNPLQHVSYPLLNGTSVCVIVCACACVCHWLCIHVHVCVMSLCACDVILFPLLSLAPDEFDAVSVQNVGSTYIIVSWGLANWQ